jgi:hypothetical protein
MRLHCLESTTKTYGTNMKRHNAYILSSMVCFAAAGGIGYFGISAMSPKATNSVVESSTESSPSTRTSYIESIKLYSTLSMVEKYAK